MQQESGWFPPWLRGFLAFKVERKWLNLGALRFMGLRAFQITAYASMILNFIGVEGGILSVLTLLAVGAIYGIVDYAVIVPQEMSFVMKKNPYLNERLDRLERLLETRQRG